MAYSQSHEFRQRSILAALLVIEDEMMDEEEFLLTQRTHQFWARPFLAGRDDMSQRNTLAKFERDLIRVSTMWPGHNTIVT